MENSSFLDFSWENNQDNSIWTASCLPSWQLGHCPALRHPPSVLSLSCIWWWFHHNSCYDDDDNDDSYDDNCYHSFDDDDEKTNFLQTDSSLIVNLNSSMTRLCKNIPKSSQNLCLVSTTLVKPPPIFCKRIHGPILLPLSLSLNNIFCTQSFWLGCWTLKIYFFVTFWDMGKIVLSCLC